MKIYHYTTLETLALILKNRTLRFNNVKNMNDPEESVTEDFKSSLKIFRKLLDSKSRGKHTVMADVQQFCTWCPT